MRVTVSAREQKARRLSTSHLEQAVGAFRRDGYVVIENAVPHERLNLLREKMDEDARLMIEREKWGGGGHLKGHLQQAPPPFAPFVLSDIVANPFAIQVNIALLGPGIYNALYTANTNSPGRVKQPLHRDGSLLWPGHEFAHPTSATSSTSARAMRPRRTAPWSCGLGPTCILLRKNCSAAAWSGHRARSRRPCGGAPTKAASSCVTCAGGTAECPTARIRYGT